MSKLKMPNFFRRRLKLWGVGLGAGILGAFAFAIRRAIRPQARGIHAIPPAIFATRVLYTSRGQLVYHESGQSDPLIFIHGVYVGASSYEWSKVYPYFADTHMVLAVDLLGFGESERSERKLTAADHIQALTEFTRAKSGGCRATMVATGLGAAFATVVAAQHPELVERLILVMPTGAGDVQPLPRQHRFLSRLPLVNRLFYRRYLSRRTQILNWLGRFGFSDSGKITEEMVNVLVSSAQQFGAERAIFSWLTKSFDLDLEQRLADLVQPVTFVWADKAIYPPLEFAYRLQSAVQKPSLVVLENVGFLASLESPSQMVEVLSRELDRTIRVFRANDGASPGEVRDIG